MLLINIFFYVVRNVVRKSLIFQKESSYPFYTVRFFSNLKSSLSVLIKVGRVYISSEKSQNAVAVKD